MSFLKFYVFIVFISIADGLGSTGDSESATQSNLDEKSAQLKKDAVSIGKPTENASASKKPKLYYFEISN